VAFTYWAVGDYAAALEAIRTDNDGFRGLVLAALNRPDEALASLDEPRRRSAGYPTQTAYVELLRACLLKQRKIFESRVEQVFRSTFRDPEGFIYVAIMAMWMEQPAVALTSLARAVEQGCACFPHLEREPAFQALKGDAQFARLLADTERRHREAADAFAAANGQAIVAENI
jgi:hypothetical protein